MTFIVHNDGFTCEYCGEENPPAHKTCRNHCRKCFSSKHMDASGPGDRAALCGGKMPFVNIVMGKRNTFSFVHRCELCGEERQNKVADDDDLETALQLLEKRNEEKVRRGEM